MKYLTRISCILFLFIASCQLPKPTSKNSIWRNETQMICTKDELIREINDKIDRLKNFLISEKLDGILLTQVRNFYWITAGIANNQIVLNKDVGAATIFIRKDGAKFLLCSYAEAGRLMDESLMELGYELKQFNWYETNAVKDVRGEIVRELSQGGKIGSDIDFPGAVNVDEKFKRLRFTLSDSEIKRLRWVGRQTTEAIANVCRLIQPGMGEYEIEAMTSAELRSRGIIPTVLLIGVDDRISKYRHALPGGAKLQKYGMINVVAEKWGMPVAVTRFVHFGPLPNELKTKLVKTAKVNAHYQLATVPGKNLAELFEECKSWYGEAGYPDEWKLHHQGGAIGYDDREYVIYPGVNEVVQSHQAFAWNPTITGAKVEDTIIIFDDHFEVITIADNWPMIKTELNGKVYEQPGILIR